MLKEIIVVEGKDDVAAVKKAVEAECIITGGFALSKETLKRIKLASERKGVIVFTDPDRAGEIIRRRITKAVKGCKHAFLPQDEGILDGDIGIENASPEAIRVALKKVRVEQILTKNTFTRADMFKHGLEGLANASDKRAKLGKILGIGYTNGKQFLRRLNNYGITRAEFEDAVKERADSSDTK